MVNFIQQEIENDLKAGKYSDGIHTRFPPEPNGYLHIGHAKSVCLNFGLANYNNGICNLRFDDTNPTKEDVEYVDSIQADIKWLGFDWEDRKFYASDYFGKFYDYAVELIKRGLAYVDDLSAEEIKAYRGTLTEAGKESPCRNRSVEENLDLFARMKAGEFADGEKVLRAKIDMSSPNINMRDPVIYRITRAHHHHTGDEWLIYPMYDFAHPLEDAIEKITHSVCTLEFEDHRPFYDWLLDSLGFDVNSRPRQIEFARLDLTNTITSKRKLRQLVEENYVRGWDDPRMPTVCALRRRGYTPESLWKFAEKVGVAKRDNIIDVSLLEFCIREDLNKKANRVMAVLNPIKVTITNYPEEQQELLDAVNNPEDATAGTRQVPFSKHILIERDDFMENPPKKYFRLAPGQEVRLRWAYFITCNEVIKDANGNIIELKCTYDPQTKGGNAPDGRKVKGTIHWVNEPTAVEAEIRLYDRLFLKEDPDDCPEGQDFISNLNPDSLKIVNAYLEPELAKAKPLDKFQFERIGYFCCDKDSTPQKLVFNRTVTLKDTWAKINK